MKSLNINLKLELKADLPSVYADANRLQQVLLNLMTNACQAMAKGGDLVVSTYADKTDLCIQVDDSGCGISKENFSKIFDPFFTTKPPGKGTGLGLSVSYRIIREHNGTIDVESEEGKGTRFTVRLPAIKEGR